MEFKVAELAQTKPGERRRVRAGDRDILLVRAGDKILALPAECPHYHGPLEQGVVNHGRLVCPWHEATYGMSTGDLLEPPSFFALPAYDVRVAEGHVYVEVPAGAAGQRTPVMTAADRSRDARLVLLIGSGAAAAVAAETMRQEGYAGRILMVGPEDRPPYDRPNCSKDLLAGTMSASWMPLRSPAFYEKWGIERRMDTVTKLDATTREVQLESGDWLKPDAVLVASGSTARELPITGAGKKGVFTLRSWDDCEAIVAAAQDATRAIVVGGSFIGLEAAASLRHRGFEVTVVMRGANPLESAFGTAIGGALRALHESHGVRFAVGRTVRALLGKDAVTGVELDDGSRLQGQILLTGVGVSPATGFVAGPDKAADGSLVVDGRLRVSGADGVWAAGDVARYPAAHLGGQAVRIEHWRLALQHGRHAARSILGAEESFAGVPFFWTQQYGLRLGCSGYALPWTEVIADGDPSSQEDFIAYYVGGGRVQAAAGTRDAQLAAFAELMRDGRLPSANELRARPGIDLRAALQNT